MVEEQAQTLQRTAFSTIGRESGDLAACVFYADGRMLAQAVTGTSGQINTMALTVGHVIDHYPIVSMQATSCCCCPRFGCSPISWCKGSRACPG